MEMEKEVYVFGLHWGSHSVASFFSLVPLLSTLSIPNSSFSHCFQMLPIRTLPICLRTLLQLLFINETINRFYLLLRRHGNLLLVYINQIKMRYLPKHCIILKEEDLIMSRKNKQHSKQFKLDAPLC